MRQVVTKTYTTLNYDNIKLAGKSGTAEVGFDEVNNMTKQNSWFVSYDQTERNMVLSVTVFDTHLLSFSEAVDATGTIFTNLYSDEPYSPPAPVEINYISMD